MSERLSVEESVVNGPRGPERAAAGHAGTAAIAQCAGITEEGTALSRAGALRADDLLTPGSRDGGEGLRDERVHRRESIAPG